MSEDQSHETSDNDTMGGPTDPFILLKVRAAIDAVRKEKP